MNIKKTIKNVENTKTRSAWRRGVKTYALEILESLENPQEICNIELLKKAALNGAADWQQYSEGGCALIYDTDIAERLCNPTELKKTNGGEKYPNARESWIDVQARALFQAWKLIRKTVEF
jgi:hypothetical protein